MKLSPKTKSLLSIILIFGISLIYVFAIVTGIQKLNINLQETTKVTGVVENFGIDIHYGSKGRASKVFYVKLIDLEEKVGVYRFSKKYNDLLQLMKTGDVVNIYYYKNSNNRENVNIDLVQIEKGNKVLLPKSEYEKKESALIYIGIGGLIANIVIIYYNRKKYWVIKKSNC